MKKVALNLCLSRRGLATVKWDLLESSKVRTTSFSGMGSTAGVAGTSVVETRSKERKKGEWRMDASGCGVRLGVWPVIWRNSRRPS